MSRYIGRVGCWGVNGEKRKKKVASKGLLAPLNKSTPSSETPFTSLYSRPSLGLRGALGEE